MLALEALNRASIATEISAQYVDHNLLQTDSRNPDDHVFLESACRKYGVWYSRPGNGVSHPLHMQLFGRPGATLLGSDSHTCAAGCLGMLAIGTGGIDVAMAIAGEPYRLRRPKVWGVRLEGSLPPWVSAKDIILELLRRHGVDGGVGYVIEYHGPGIQGLRVVLAKSFSRLHHDNLVNFGVVPLLCDDTDDIEVGDALVVDDVSVLLEHGAGRVDVGDRGGREVRHSLTHRQVEIVRAGGVIAHTRDAATGPAARPAGANAESWSLH